MKNLFRKDVWRLLRRNMSKGQLVGYMAANVIGLSVVLIGVQFFTDSRHSSDDGDAFFSKDYVVLSKKVEGVGFTPTNFSEEEIEELKAQPWVRKTGNFTASQFAVNGAVNMGGRGLSSYMFFESVPDEFFDVKPRDWQFNPDSKFVPVIISKDYLALYNFGFAMPQGLPQVSEEVIGAVPITLTFIGIQGEPETFEGSIVGFSSRLNTIAVPQSFMEWANARYAPGITSPPSRLIVEIDRMAAADVMGPYLEERGIEVAGDEENAGNISSFLSIVSGVVTTNGLVICLLAIFILILSIFLMLQKSRATLRNIMLLGYGPAELAHYYETIVVVANMLIAVMSLGITLSVRHLWNARLLDIGIGDGSFLPMLATLAVYVVAVMAIDFSVIRSHMLRIWNDK